MTSLIVLVRLLYLAAPCNERQTVDENAPIVELKKMFAKKLKDEKNIEIEPQHLRIREATWRSVGKVYPSNSTFKQCASFLWSGKAFAFQRLQGEEPVTDPKSLVLHIRRWHPSTWQIGPAEEVCCCCCSLSHRDQRFLLAVCGKRGHALGRIPRENANQVRPQDHRHRKELLGLH